MARNGLPPGSGEPPPSTSDSRFDAMLEERFSVEGRERFAREISAHDSQRVPAGFDPAAVQRRLHYRGEVPQKVRKLLTDWIPGLMAQAATQGLILRDPQIEIEVLTRAAYESAQGALPSKIKLPASSYKFDPLPHRYSLSVVLPETIASMETLLTILRAILARIYGDVFLREEIFSLEAYQEDHPSGAADNAPGNTVGMAEQLALLAEQALTNPALEAALSAYARTVGINFQKNPDHARKSFFKEAREDFERQRLAPETQAMVESVMADYLSALRETSAQEVTLLGEEVEKLNRQLNFLPPGEGPDYEKLRNQKPLHYLRSVKLRLEFALEALSGLIEDFDGLEHPGQAFSPLAEERVGGNLFQLERDGLARPYLVPGAQLSEELSRKRNGFPMEVQAMLSRFPTAEHPEKLYNSLRKKLESSLHQRMYHALVLLRQWIRLRESGRGEAFAQSAGHATLKGLVANFRFRLPLLESLFVRIGVVLDVAEREDGAAGGRKARFPTVTFARAWGQFAAHAVLAGYIVTNAALKDFDPGRYWGLVMRPQRERIGAEGAGGDSARLMVVLFEIFKGAGAQGLPVLTEVLHQAAPAFRYAVGQAMLPPPEGKSPEDWLPRLQGLAGAVLKARETSLRNAIVVGMREG